MTLYPTPTKTRPRTARCWVVVGLSGLLLSGCGEPPAPPPNTGATPARPSVQAPAPESDGGALQTQFPTAAFSTNIHDGRDPFFPESNRRLPVLPGNAVRAAETQKPPADHLKLMGLWASKTKPLAMINKTPLAPGEAADILVTVADSNNKPKSHKLVVRCVEIRSNSVLIHVEGEPGNRELVLKSKF